MSRLRSNPSLFAGLAMLATTHGGGYSHVTTRANLQIREIAAAKGPSLLEAIQDLGLTARGSGADGPTARKYARPQS